MSLLGSLFGQSVPIISVLELKPKLKDRYKPFILDVRQLVEFRLGHNAGAKLILLGELDCRIDEMPHDREIVCICASGHRSVPALQKLKPAGYTTSSMKNGMLAWQMAKLPINKGT